ncbi:MAG: DUF808 domain-containing protein [Deltaproteobacteria bacterium]|jgi:predicted DNA repair protein MutK|nr:DUF808 domain-containing protein [Deltaproteobacteria bacterium]
MAGFTLLTLLDDIASILDDVALMTKTAAQKTVGIVGDDLALTSQQVSGFRAAREIPVVVAVAKGSMVNKLILIPAALLINYALPWLMNPLLMVGGSWLALEGAEKVHEKLAHWLKGRASPPGAAGPGGEEAPPPARAPTEAEIAEKERLKIRGAVRTDFVLSAEIITIALGAIPAGHPFVTRAATLVAVGFIMTIGVYGFVAGIVKLDDLGFYLLKKPDRGKIRDALGRLLIMAAAPIMRVLGIVGTIAMFLVGGGILLHNLPIPHLVVPHGLTGYLLNIFAGVLAGFVILGLLGLGRLIVSKLRRQKAA